MDINEKQMLKDYKKLLKKELFSDLGKDMKNCACDYNKHRMISSVISTINDINEMCDWGKKHSTHDSEHDLTPEMASEWASHMENTDGKTGAHWTLEETTSVAEQYGIMFDHISPMDWMIALNMIYSDYGKTLTEAGVTDVGVYVNLAKDFLFDKDAVPPKEKLCYYYKYIVKK